MQVCIPCDSIRMKRRIIAKLFFLGGWFQWQKVFKVLNNILVHLQVYNCFVKTDSRSHETAIDLQL